MENSSDDNDSPAIIFLDQSKKLDRSTKRTAKEDLHSVEESANQSLPSPTLIKVPYQPCNQPVASSSQGRNMDQLDESTDVYFSREPRSHENCSRSKDTYESSRQPPTTTVSVLDSDGIAAKNNQNELSPFPASRRADFASPPEHGTISANRQSSKNLKETNTPSPGKRGIETDVGSTPIKKLRNTPESDLGEPGTGTESCLSNLNLSSIPENSRKSPSNLQIQQVKYNDAIQKNKEPKFLNPPPASSKRNSYSVQFLMNPQVHERRDDAQKVNESPTERGSSEIFPSASNSFPKHSNPDGLLQAASFMTLATKKHENTVSNESTDSSNHANLKNAQSTSGISDERALPTFTSKKHDIMHPPTSTDTIYRSHASGRQRNRLSVSGVSLEVVQPDLQVKEPKSDLHLVRLTDKTSNLGQKSKSQNSTAESFESCIEVNKMQGPTFVSAKKTQSASKVANSAVVTHGEFTQSLPKSANVDCKSNPQLRSSCHFSRRRNSSLANAPHCLLEFYTSDKKERIDQNRSDFSTQSSTSDMKSRFQTEELSVLRSHGRHRRSLSNETVTARNSSEVQVEGYESNTLQEKFRRSHSKESPHSYSLGIQRRYASDETLTSRDLTEVQTQQNQSNSLVMPLSKDSPKSRSLPEISKDVSQSTCVVQPLSQRKPARPASNAPPTNNTLEFSHSFRSNQLLRDVTDSFPYNELWTPRNNPGQIQGNLDCPPPRMRPERFLSGEASTSRNRPESISNLRPPYINVFERQASGSRFQHVIASGSSLEQTLATLRNGLDMMLSDYPNIGMLEGDSSTVRHEPLTADSSFSYSELNSSNTSYSGEALESASLADKHLEYIVEARNLLRSVLKELLLQNGEDSHWNLFEMSFSRVSETISELDRMNFVEDLTEYLARKAYYLYDRHRLIPYEMAETDILSVYGKLTTLVVNALIYTLTVQPSRNLGRLLPPYMRFRMLCDMFDVTYVGYVEDEISRNRGKTLKKMIERLLLVVQMAFRLLWMFVGENVPDLPTLSTFEIFLSGEDKKYLRRNIRYRF